MVLSKPLQALRALRPIRWVYHVPHLKGRVGAKLELDILLCVDIYIS